MADYKKDNTDIRFYELISNFAGKQSVRDELATSKKAHNEESRLSSDGQSSSIAPLEKYLAVGKYTRKQIFFKEIEPNMIVICRVTTTFGNLLSGYVLQTCSHQRRWIDDLKIKFTCRHSEEDLKKQHSGFDADIDVGDKIRGVVMTVNTEMEELHITMDTKQINEDAESKVELGKVEDDELKGMDFMEETDRESEEDSRNYHNDLRISSTFANPSCIHNMAALLGISTAASASFIKINSNLPSTELADSLREKQSYKWSMEMVGVGVQHFKGGVSDEAKKCFDHAITFYPRNVEALVARGALKANNNRLQEALKDFKQALLINPNHKNGKKYFTQTMMTLAKTYEKDENWQRSADCYHEVLQIDEDHQQALDKFEQAKHLLKTFASKQKQPSLDDKSKEKIHTLKKMLEEQISKKKSKGKSHRKRSRASSTSSSSSSSSSGSSRSVVEVECWVEKDSNEPKEKSDPTVKPPNEARKENEATTKPSNSDNAHKRKGMDDQSASISIQSQHSPSDTQQEQHTSNNQTEPSANKRRRSSDSAQLDTSTQRNMTDACHSISHINNEKIRNELIETVPDQTCVSQDKFSQKVAPIAPLLRESPCGDYRDRTTPQSGYRAHDKYSHNKQVDSYLKPKLHADRCEVQDTRMRRPSFSQDGGTEELSDNIPTTHMREWDVGKSDRDLSTNSPRNSEYHRVTDATSDSNNKIIAYDNNEHARRSPTKNNRQNATEIKSSASETEKIIDRGFRNKIDRSAEDRTRDSDQSVPDTAAMLTKDKFKCNTFSTKKNY